MLCTHGMEEDEVVEEKKKVMEDEVVEVVKEDEVVEEVEED